MSDASDGPPRAADRSLRPAARPASPAGEAPLRREQVVDALCEAFARDRIGIQELEVRLDRANRAQSEPELRRLVADLGPEPERGGSPASRPGAELARPEAERGAAVGRADPSRVQDRQYTIGFWSSRARKGSWVPARRIVAVAFQGGVELDFREAVFGPGVTEVHAVACMGAVEIIVAPGVHLESSGFAVMGAFEDEAVGSHPDRTDAPTIRLSGFALMGAVEVRVRLPGETEREARARKRRERREAGPNS